MDDQGNAFPAEQFPATLTDGSINFAGQGRKPARKTPSVARARKSPFPAATGTRSTSSPPPMVTSPQPSRSTASPPPSPRRAGPATSASGTTASGPATPLTRSTPGMDMSSALEPGFVEARQHRPGSLTSTKSDAVYQYSYIFKYAFDLPKGAKQIRLPNDSKIKVFAASVAKTGPASSEAAPLFDTLADHVQDPPRFWPRSGTFTDATPVRIEPTLYWKKRRDPYDKRHRPNNPIPIYAAPITLTSPTTLKAAVLDANGKLGPVATTKIDVNDTTPPQASKAIAAYQSPTVKVLFTEPVDPKSLSPASFSLEPSIAIKAVTVAEGSGVILELASAPELNKPYKLKVSGIGNPPPGPHNTMSPTSLDLLVPGARPPSTPPPPSSPSPSRSPVCQPTPKTPSRSTCSSSPTSPSPRAPPSPASESAHPECKEPTASGATTSAASPRPAASGATTRDAPSRTPHRSGQSGRCSSATYDGQTLRLYKKRRKGRQTSRHRPSPTTKALRSTLAPKRPLGPRTPVQRRSQGLHHLVRRP